MDIEMQQNLELREYNYTHNQMLIKEHKGH